MVIRVPMELIPIHSEEETDYFQVDHIPSTNQFSTSQPHHLSIYHTALIILCLFINLILKITPVYRMYCTHDLSNIYWVRAIIFFLVCHKIIILPDTSFYNTRARQQIRIGNIFGADYYE